MKLHCDFSFYSTIKEKALARGLECAHCDEGTMNNHKCISMCDGNHLRRVSYIHSKIIGTGSI
jgi:hypothetical protein